jgi:predicted DNA-binding protein (UPF0251 family)
MNKQTQVQKLQAGEALAHPAFRKGRIVLVEGEVLVQAPAGELAGMTMVPAARRVSAPAILSLAEVEALRATQSAMLVLEEAPSTLAVIAAALARRRTNAQSAILASLTRGGAAW